MWINSNNPYSLLVELLSNEICTEKEFSEPFKNSA